MNERMNIRKIRNQKGAAVTGLVLALFFFIMLMGFFCFDSSRIQMAQRELTATCDSASLAGTAMLTSYPTANDSAANNYPLTVAAQSGACQYALNMFQAGNLLGQPLTNAIAVSPYSAVGQTGAAGSTNVMVSLADPTNDYIGVSPTPPACVNGKAIMVYACYTYKPVFLWIVGVGTVGLNAASGGGLPQVDAVLVFDYSGSMDDATNVSFVRRTWDSTITDAMINTSAQSSGAFDWVSNYNASPLNLTPTLSPTFAPTIQATPNSGAVHYIEITPPTTGASSHELAQYLQYSYATNANGMATNVLPPQNLDECSVSPCLASPEFEFDQNLRSNTLPFTTLPPKQGSISVTAATNAGTKFQADFGTPPGNCTLDYPFGYGQPYNPNSLAGGNVYVYLPGAAGGPLPCGYDMAYCSNTLPAPLMSDMQEGNGQQPTYIATATDTASISTYREFTDLVVNIGNPGTWPYTQPLTLPGTYIGFSNFTFPAQEPDPNLANQTFSFEDLGVVVEAARGNLDLTANAQGALLDRNAYWSIPENGSIKQLSAVNASSHVEPHYQEAYQRLAMLYSQPIATAMDGADGGFFQKINSLCDCRFGLVGFSNANGSAGPNLTTLGTAQGTTSDNNSYYVSTEYQYSPAWQFWWDGAATTAPSNNVDTAGGIGQGFRQPRRALNATEPQTTSVDGVDGCRINSSQSSPPLQLAVTTGVSAPWNYNNSNAQGAYANGLENGTPVDSTDTDEALATAYGMFTSGSYSLSSRPAAKHAIVFFSDGVPTPGNSNPNTATTSQCLSSGIAIYSIGMDVTNNPTLQADQVSFMGNGTNGLSYAAGNGGRFFQCTSSATVQQAFNAVARRMAQSQR